MHVVQGLDHLIVLVHDLDAAEAAMRRLGFLPTPRGVHSDSMGTHNATIVLPDRTTYFEVLAVRLPTPANARARSLLEAGDGLAGVIFKTVDADATASAFAAAGVADGEALHFARPVEIGGRTAEARFSIARLQPEATPGTWSFACTHHTPELVWREDYLEQPNGALGIVEVVGVAADTAPVETAYRRLFADRVTRDAAGLHLACPPATLRWLTPEAFGQRYGTVPALLEGGPARLRAVVLATADLDRTRNHLKAAGVAVVSTASGGIATHTEDGAGTVFEFVPAA